jgi:hypothetical protein
MEEQPSESVRDRYFPGQLGGGFSGAPFLSPGPDLPGPPPTLFWPGEHCLLPGPGGPAHAGAAVASMPAATTAVTTFLILTFHSPPFP